MSQQSRLEESLKSYERELTKRHYSPLTIPRYMASLKQLAEFYPETAPEDISMEQIEDFFKFLVRRRRLAAQTVHQFRHSFHLYYNDILKKNYDLKSLKLPYKKRHISEILTQSEVLTVLNTVKGEKNRLIVALIYSAGLEVSEAVRLKVSDVDFDNKRITVKRTRGRGLKNVILSEYVSKELREYIKTHKLTDWLFEGVKEGSHHSTDAILKTFKRALRTAGIDKKTTPRHLRYSYVKHLEYQGVPLPNILKELEILSGQTLLFFSLLDTRDTGITFSPLDRIVYSDSIDTTPLERALVKVRNPEERDYLLEAVRCINAHSFRAAVIFVWTAAIRNIHHRCINRHSLTSVNASIKKYAPKAPQVGSVDDFAYIKDSVVLEVAKDIGEFDKNEKGTLVDCLNLRNRCGHPGKYKPEALKVASFIEDLITVVFSKT